ncbi:hypothetical protein [Actinoallomurus oryzae]
MTATYRTISFGFVAVGAGGLVTTVIWVAATPLRHMREVPQAASSSVAAEGLTEPSSAA